jgi:hypothetical protein
MTDLICDRCGKKPKINEHLNFHSKIVKPTRLCTKCEGEWDIYWHTFLRGKPDGDWIIGFEKFIRMEMRQKEVIEFT